MDAIRNINTYRSFFGATLILIGWASSTCAVLADAKVSATPDGVQIEANNATIEEILSALNATFGLTYIIHPTLGQRVDGIYGGSVATVLRRLLKDQDYVLQIENGKYVLVVANQQKGAGSSTPSASSNPQLRAPTRRDEANDLNDSPAAVSSKAPPPSNASSSSVTTLLQTQTKILQMNMARNSNGPNSARSLEMAPPVALREPDLTSTGPSQSAMAAMQQRATASLNALVGALKSLPPR